MGKSTHIREKVCHCKKVLKYYTYRYVSSKESHIQLFPLKKVMKTSFSPPFLSIFLSEISKVDCIIIPGFEEEGSSSVCSVADLRTGDSLFDPRLGQYSFRGLMILIFDRTHFSLTAVCCFDNGYVGKQPVVWKEHCVEY